MQHVQESASVVSIIAHYKSLRDWESICITTMDENVGSYGKM